MTQATSPTSKLARSKRRLQTLKELAQRKSLSADLKKKLPALIEMQEIAVRLRKRAELKLRMK